jgi:uncharacterized membrane protein HdeD (DUF308 family)
MEDDHTRQLLQRLATKLFWINLAPSVVAGVVVVVALLYAILDFKQGSFYFALFLGSGLLCQWVYNKQRLSTEYAAKPIGWIFSVITNIIFLSPQVAFLFSKENGTFILLLMIYPISFLVVSFYALIKIRKLNHQVKGD